MRSERPMAGSFQVSFPVAGSTVACTPWIDGEVTVTLMPAKVSVTASPFTSDTAGFDDRTRGTGTTVKGGTPPKMVTFFSVRSLKPFAFTTKSAVGTMTGALVCGKKNAPLPSVVSGGNVWRVGTRLPAPSVP